MTTCIDVFAFFLGVIIVGVCVVGWGGSVIAWVRK